MVSKCFGLEEMRLGISIVRSSIGLSSGRVRFMMAFFSYVFNNDLDGR